MSIKSFKDLLASFKRSNKERKLKLANKAGFPTIEKYKEYLENRVVAETTVIPVKKGVKTPRVKKKENTTGNLTDMVIAFDTTGSMMGYINNVKKHVTELIPKLFSQNPGLKISIVAFGDYCDMQSLKVFGKAYQVIGLTDNANELIKFVNEAQNTGGGDTDEFYELVIKKVTEDTEWRDGSGKNVLLIGDYGPHKPGYICNGIRYNIDWKEEAKKAANKGIIFDTLQILKGISFYKELSEITGGVCLPFSNSNKTADLMEATSLARGGETTRNAFMAKSVSSEVTMDGDINKVYGMYKNIIK